MRGGIERWARNAEEESICRAILTLVDLFQSRIGFLDDAGVICQESTVDWKGAKGGRAHGKKRPAKDGQSESQLAVPDIIFSRSTLSHDWPIKQRARGSHTHTQGHHRRHHLARTAFPTLTARKDAGRGRFESLSETARGTLRSQPRSPSPSLRPRLPNHKEGAPGPSVVLALPPPPSFILPSRSARDTPLARSVAPSLVIVWIDSRPIRDPPWRKSRRVFPLVMLFPGAQGRSLWLRQLGCPFETSRGRQEQRKATSSFCNRSSRSTRNTHTHSHTHIPFVGLSSGQQKTHPFFPWA